MPTKTAQHIAHLIKTCQNGKAANTTIENGRVRFYGHLIAKCCPISGSWSFCLQGWPTNATRDRINAVRAGAGLGPIRLTQFRDVGDDLRWWTEPGDWK